MYSIESAFYLGVAMFFGIIATAASAQDIYKWKDEKGQWHFSQTSPPNNVSVEKFTLPSRPTTLPADTPCSPFKPGETRRSLATDNSDTSVVQIIDLSVKMIESRSGVARFAWKLIVKNNTARSPTVMGVFKLMDCEKFLIADDRLVSQIILSSREATIDGEKSIYGDAGARVGRFSLQIDRGMLR